MRYTILATAVLFSAATAVAAIAPATRTADVDPRHMTIMEKNQAFPLVGPLIIEDCVADDCESPQDRI